MDITEPEAGWVNDGIVRDEDITYSAEAASLYSNWGDYFDPESGIDTYKVTLSVNGEVREVFEKDGTTEFMEDHTQHFEHSDFIEVSTFAYFLFSVHNNNHICQLIELKFIEKEALKIEAHLF